jgi:hypothetical protein
MRSLVTLGLALALTAFAGTVTVTHAADFKGAVTAAPTTKPERHPAIHAALRGLREAKNALEKADHDFQGHRVAALKDVDAAIAECEEALKADPN